MFGLGNVRFRKPFVYSTYLSASKALQWLYFYISNTKLLLNKKIKTMKTSKIILAIVLLTGLFTAEVKSSNAQTNQSRGEVSKEAIRPFKAHFSEKELTDLKQRIKQTRWSEKEIVNDYTQGVPQGTVQALAKYWATDYDWHQAEAKLNAYPQFITNIDGLDIHFIHVRSKNPKALPIILTHGWPGSILELLKIIDPLVNPVAYGGKAEDAFDVVIPSIPGYGFSEKPTTTGWVPNRIADAWVTLMKRLGYQKFLAQGGDWGAIITEVLAVQSPDVLLGIHTNMPSAVPVDIDKAAIAGAPVPAGLSAEENHTYDQLVFFYKHVYYAFFMATRPQTLAALTDSPIGLATFMLDHDDRSLKLIARTFAGESTGLTKDDILDNITLYWLTNTAVSSARLYWENRSTFFTPKGVTVPTAVSAFPDELYQAPRSWAEQAYPNLIYFNKTATGGHFAAWEQPKIFSEELRAAFKSLR
jgi:pimeloyl-ACP methyl ester carboxylesterase